MHTLEVAQYNAFTASVFGGNPAGLVAGAQLLDEPLMRRLARELNLPATAFVRSVSSERVEARFFSTRSEYAMCGHAAVALMTWLYDRGALVVGDEPAAVMLATPVHEARCLLSLDDDCRVRVRLTLAPATFEDAPIPDDPLRSMLRIGSEGLRSELPRALTRRDFTQLVVPVRGLEAIARIDPDFDAITRYCTDNATDSLVVFTTETADTANTVHMREFCPAIGTPESAAAGTTNRALACYLLDNGVLSDRARRGTVEVRAEQGHAMGRPSLISTEIDLVDGAAVEARVGGVATKFLEGTLAV